MSTSPNINFRTLCRGRELCLAFLFLLYTFQLGDIYYLINFSNSTGEKRINVSIPTLTPHINGGDISI